MRLFLRSDQMLKSFFTSISSSNLVLYIFIFLISVVPALIRTLSPFTSPWDEHSHLSYVQYAMHGIIPAQGYEMNSWAKAAFSCHPHSIYGAMTGVPCGEIGPGSAYPTGGTNTSQGWAPIYFILAAILIAPFKLLGLLGDPLIGTRMATAIIWSAGMTLVAFGLRRLKAEKISILLISLVVSSVSIFSQDASYVTPHSLVPTIIGLGLLALGFEFDKIAENSDSSRYKFHSLLRWVGLYAFTALAVPQAVFALPIFSISYLLYTYRSKPKSLRLKQFFLPVGIQIAGVITGIAVKVAWDWQNTMRTVPFPAGVNVGGLNPEGTLAEYPNLFVRFVSTWNQFWPNNYFMDQDWQGRIIDSLWAFVLPAFVVASIVAVKKSSGVIRSTLMGLVIWAPFASFLMGFMINPIPARYALAFSFVGLLGLAIPKKPKSVLVILISLALVSYTANFTHSPLVQNATTCFVNPDTSLIDCPKPTK